MNVPTRREVKQNEIKSSIFRTKQEFR